MHAMFLSSFDDREREGVKQNVHVDPKNLFLLRRVEAFI